MKVFTKIILLILATCFLLSTTSLALSPESTNFYQGIDVSNWQGTIDYQEVKNQGIKIVYIKSSQGTTYKDPYFEKNYENAKKNGLKVGVYHYLTARNESEAIKEANFFASILSDKEIDCKLAMDFESFGNLNKEEINNISKTFLQEVEKLTNRKTIVYSDLFNAKNTFELSNNYPLWIAFYNNYQDLENIQTNWQTWEGQQYTDVGKIAGIKGNIDRDIFTPEIFLEDNSKINKTPGNQEQNISERIIYTVQPGNTLWGLSKEFDVTIEEIANLNNIQNPNLIFVGEKLEIITNTNYNQTGALGKTLYTVKPGDTLSELAIRFDTTVERIVNLNNIQNPNLIFVGQRLRI